MKSPFIKLQSSGNSFLFFESSSPQKLSPRQVQNLCDPNLGIGADGLVLLKKTLLRQKEKKEILEKLGSKDQKLSQKIMHFKKNNKPSCWRWIFYNQDGSQADMCGNAAVCFFYWLARYKKSNYGVLKTKKQILWGSSFFHEKKMVSHVFFFSTVKRLSSFKKNPLIQAFVPHLLVFTLKTPLGPCAPFLTRKACLLQKQLLQTRGLLANITFVFLKKRSLDFVSYERGVFRLTKSCGTGALASSYYFSQKNKTFPEKPVLCKSPGGNLRAIHFSSSIQLTGWPETIFQGKYIGK